MMRHRIFGRNARKLLAGILAAVNMVGGIPAYAAEPENLEALSVTDKLEAPEEGTEEVDSIEVEQIKEEEKEAESESTVIEPEEMSEERAEEVEETSAEEPGEVPEEEGEEPEKVSEEEKEESEEVTGDEESGGEIKTPEEIKGQEEQPAKGTVDEALTEENFQEPEAETEDMFFVEEDMPELTAEGNGYTYDVTENGANGNDKAPDNVAIQNVLDQAWKGNVPDGQKITVKIPAGTYYLDDGLYIYDHTELVLDKDTIMIRNNQDKLMLYNAHRDSAGKFCFDKSCTHGGYTQTEDISVSGGIWDGNVRDTSAAGAAIFTFLHAENIVIENMTLKNCNDSHLLVLNGIKNARIDGVKFMDHKFYTGPEKNNPGYYPEGFSVKSSYSAQEQALLAEYKEAVHIDAMNKVGTSTYPLDNTVCAGITVQNCHFENGLAGVGAHHSAEEFGTVLFHSGIVIRNNKFINMKGIAVPAFSMKDAKVSGNTIDNVYNFADLYGTTAALNGNSAVNIKSSVIYADGHSSVTLDDESYQTGTGQIIDNYAIEVVDGSTCTIRGRVNKDTITTGKVGGIRARDNSTVTVDTVTIKSAGKIAGIFIDGANGQITNNTISGLKGEDAGVFIQNNTDQTVSIQNNKISNFSVGVQILESTGMIMVSGNNVGNTVSHGIWLRNSRAAISNNTINNAGDKSSGIRIVIENGKALAYNMTVSGNKVTGTYQGISVKNEKNIQIKNNTVLNCKDTGISVNASGNITVTGNKVTGTSIRSGESAAWDIAFWDCTSGTCSGNTVTKDLSGNIRQSASNKITVKDNYTENGVTGWVKNGKSWYYLKKGVRQTGWQEIAYKGSKCWFYLDPTYGNMLTGWQQIKGKWYYLDPNDGGKMLTNWQKIKGYWYYLDPIYGNMLVGWQQIKGKWYYLDGNAGGAMSVGWKQVKGKWYYLDASAGGAMSTGWKKIKGYWYYLDAQAGGAMSTGWKQISKKWYYLDNRTGGAMSVGWKQIGGKWYYLDAASGGAMTVGWKKINGYWYYMDGNGCMCTGNRKINGKTYKFSSNGVLMN